jgi:hypothetical protein
MWGNPLLVTLYASRIAGEYLPGGRKLINDDGAALDVSESF